MNKSWILLTLLLLVACGGQVYPTPLPPEATNTPRPTQNAAGAAAAVTVVASTVPTASATPLPEPVSLATAGPTATFTPLPSPTSFPTPSLIRPDIADLPPVAPVELGQVPYAASDCSDRYPCNEDIDGWEARLRVPAGFRANYFSRIDGLPTVITPGPDGLLYVGTMAGEIFTVDSEGQVQLFLSGLLVPTGLAFQPGTGQLYIASRVVNAEQGEAMVSYLKNGQIVPLLTGLPCCYTSYHAANGLSFGPDGYGYVGIGARADHGEVLDTAIQDELWPIEATILRFAPDGSEMEAYAYGLRNSYDHAWDSQGHLFASDNAPDAQDGWHAPDELHLVVPGAQHGYPWYDCGLCFKPPADVEVLPPTFEFVPHSSPTGVAVYLGDSWAGYYDSVFVTLWSAFAGAQKVVHLSPGGEAGGDFLTGLSSPVDITFGPDGQMYVVDFFTGIIVRVSAEGA